MTDVKRMEAGRALNCLVAEKVFGEVEANAPCGDGLTRTATIYAPTMADCEKQIAHAYKKAIAGGLKMWPAQYIGPEYSSDIAAAFLVVEKMRGQGYYFGILDQRHGCYRFQCDGPPFIGYRVEVGEWHEGEEVPTDIRVAAHAATAPHAICLAALTALTVEVPR